jgi:hypothetical protein
VILASLCKNNRFKIHLILAFKKIKNIVGCLNI